MSLAAIPEIPPRPPRRRAALARWRRARRCLTELLAHPDDTGLAVELGFAVQEGELERAFQRFARDPDGRRMLCERPRLLDRLEDRDRLAALPEASLGRAYLAYLDANGFRARALVDLSDEVGARFRAEEGIADPDPMRAWYLERRQLLHDLLHVMTGYGTDGAGEATLLVFSLAQLPGLGAGFLTAGASWQMTRDRGAPWLRQVRETWRRGRGAEPLDLLPFERLLPAPLDAVRRLGCLQPLEQAHPHGLLCDIGSEAA